MFSGLFGPAFGAGRMFICPAPFFSKYFQHFGRCFIGEKRWIYHFLSPSFLTTERASPSGRAPRRRITLSHGSLTRATDGGTTIGGHYFDDLADARHDFNARVAEYKRRFGVHEVKPSHCRTDEGGRGAGGSGPWQDRKKGPAREER